MNYKKIIPYINAENSIGCNVVLQAKEYEYNGADELYLFNYTKNESDREEFYKIVKKVASDIDIPIIIGCYAERFEDIKKAFYTGASYVCLHWEEVEHKKLLKEGVERFGEDKIIVELNANNMVNWDVVTNIPTNTLFIKHVDIIRDVPHWKDLNQKILIRDSLYRNDLIELLSMEQVIGVSTNYFEGKDLMKAKWRLKEHNMSVNTFESSLSFDTFKLNSDGLLPVVVQDYKSNEVLMVAYMNEEAFTQTIQTGKMTYYSRSRKELWVKGSTSGHYQYVKCLQIDCDKDTILAKVLQIGPACHTGNQSCFYTDLVKKEYDNTNPFTVFEDVYSVIMDRKRNPKEGSYTNYLFDKGIDKILKKCGEEATEIVIAAKNPDSEELKYEISDFLYHMMVLMAETGLEWKDIIKELSHRK